MSLPTMRTLRLAEQEKRKTIKLDKCLKKKKKRNRMNTMNSKARSLQFLETKHKHGIYKKNYLGGDIYKKTVQPQFLVISSPLSFLYNVSILGEGLARNNKTSNF